MTDGKKNPRKRKPRQNNNSLIKNKMVTNSFTEMMSQLATINGFTGGSTLSSYGTAAFSNNYSLLTLNRIILTYMYTGNGLFQTAIQQPILDAISKGVDIDAPDIDSSDIDTVMDYWEEADIWSVILNAWTWVRLFGGGAVLVNSNQDPEEPIDYDKLYNQPIEFYDIDRWQMDVNVAVLDDWDSYTAGDGDGTIYLYGQPIHESRFMRGRGKRAPHYVRRQLRGWGMSEGERMIRDLNLYLKTQDVTYELLDEAKVDIYKINGLAQKLMTAGGTSAITQRVQTANQIKNYVNALVLDAQEEYESKSMTFSGLAEVMEENRIGIAAALRIPINKLFGQSATGFASGQDSMEVYNGMVESEIRTPLTHVVRKLLKISFAHVLGYVPDFRFEWPSLRELTPEVEQQVKDAEANRVLSFYDRGLIDSEETMQTAEKLGLIDIETKAGKGLLPPQPVPPAQPEDIVDMAEIGADTKTEETGKQITTPDGLPIDIQDTALNGAQISSVVEVVGKVTAGEITPDSAVEILMVSIPSLTPERAASMVGLNPKKYKRKNRRGR